jgi:hypothetical protein
MLWAPSLAPNCGPDETGADPTTGIKCIGDIGPALGIQHGWVWSLSTAFYWKSEDRQTIYDAAVNAQYKHFVVNVVDCSGIDFYHGVYPDCATLPARYGVSNYGAVVNQILAEVIARGMFPICTGVSPAVPPAAGVNTSLCQIAMDDFDGAPPTVEPDSALHAECRIAAVSAAFPNALVYYEFPHTLDTAVAPTSGGNCSPAPVNDGASWLAHIEQRFPNFAGVLYETGSGESLTDDSTYLTKLHGFWTSAPQEVRFEIDTFEKFWEDAGAPGGQTYSQFNDAIQAQSPFLHGFMSGGTTHTPPSPPQLLWESTSDGTLVSWFMNGLTMTSAACGGCATQWSPSAEPDLTWSIVGFGDFNNDGQADVLWVNADGSELVVWYMNGTTIIGNQEFAGTTDPSWRPVAVADFDRDGHPDIFWQQSTTRQMIVWFMSNTTRLSVGSITPTTTDTSYRVVAVADVNGDRYPDLIWQQTGNASQPETGNLVVWTMYGLTRGPALVPPAATNGLYTVVGATDLDGDGQPDLVWQQNADPGDIVGWLMAWTTSPPTMVSGGFTNPAGATTSGWKVHAVY